MKICAKCQIEYPDDMGFCSRCGTPLQPKIKEYSCPTCGKLLGKEIPQFCPYCGQQFASTKINEKDNLIKDDNPVETESTFSNSDFIMCASVTVFSLLATRSVFGLARGLVTGFMFVFCKKFYKQKRYIALVLTIIVAVLFNTMLSIAMRSSKNSTSLNFGSVTQTTQTSNKETASDVLGKYYKPDLKTLKPVQNKIFTNEMEAEAEILPTAERCAIDATKLLLPSVNYPRLYCINAFDTFLGRDQQYNIIIAYCLIDTITYPQKDLMDYWEIGMTETLVNNKVKEHGYPKVVHKQFNKQTNEERVIEKRILGYGKNDGKPMLVTANEFPQALSVSAEEMAFKKRKIPWQEIKNERMRKFYEFF